MRTARGSSDGPIAPVRQMAVNTVVAPCIMTDVPIPMREGEMACPDCFRGCGRGWI